MRLWLKTKILAGFGSQTKFVRELGKRDEWLTRIIRGTRDPSAQDKELIASKLGIKDGEECEALFIKQGQI